MKTYLIAKTFQKKCNNCDYEQNNMLRESFKSINYCYTKNISKMDDNGNYVVLLIYI